MIHPSAMIDPRAELDPTVEVGPFCVIDAHVQLGPRCRLGPGVHLTGRLRAGADNHFYTGSVVGEAPQDLKYRDAPTRVVLGDSNVVREHATIHRSNRVDEDTVVGSHCFIMAHAHVGHNARLGNHVILANGALVAGHVEIGDRAFISGHCLIHQFVRVGALALMQGGAAISQDLPPYLIATGQNTVCGLNVVGLRRAGLTPAERTELKTLYHILFRQGRPRAAALAEGMAQCQAPPSQVLLQFVAAAKRGVCSAPTHRGSAAEMAMEPEE